jgi:hypothetical protein
MLVAYVISCFLPVKAKGMLPVKAREIKTNKIRELAE